MVRVTKRPMTNCLQIETGNRRFAYL